MKVPGLALQFGICFRQFLPVADRGFEFAFPLQFLADCQFQYMLPALLSTVDPGRSCRGCLWAFFAFAWIRGGFLFLEDCGLWAED